MKNQNTPRLYLFGISGWLPLRSAFLLLSTAAALLGAPLDTHGGPVNFVITGSLATARNGHTATLLPNGKVLIAGGRNGNSGLASAELYDPASGTWTATGSLATARAFHTATLLPNGKVLVAGGGNNSAELYDPASGPWSATGSLATARAFHTATLLLNGKVLIVAGEGNGAPFVLASAELYDPASGTWSATGSLASARAGQPSGQTATLLPHGTVLVAGGGDTNRIRASAEQYEPPSATRSATGSPATARATHTATLLPDGKALVAGGFSSFSGGELASAELYNMSQLDTTQPLLNISTRARVLTQDEVLIGGFIITGAQDKTVLIRGIGPSLTTFGIAMPLADPTLELHDHTSALIVSNDNWRDSQQSQISATGLAPSSDSESVILATLAPGAYTAVLQGKAMTTGTGLIEIYDVDQNPNTQIANLSTRGFVGTGDDVMIGGTIFHGSPGTAYRILLHAIGPSLASMGVATPLLDPALSLYDANGSIITTDDNWKDFQRSEIAATGLAPTDDRESAIIVTLPAGAYTAIVRGVNGTTGVGLVEVFNLH